MIVKPLFMESDMLRDIAAGDRRAFDLLFEQHQHLVFSIALKLTQSRSLAREVVQDVFLKLWIKRTELEGIHNFGAYVNRISRNQSIDVLRKIARDALRTVELKEDQLDRGIQDTQETLDFRETGRMITEALGTLPPQQRRVYELCHEQGLKYEEAAEKMGLSTGTVHSHMKMALKNIRIYLKSRDAILLAMLLLNK